MGKTFKTHVKRIHLLQSGGLRVMHMTDVKSVNWLGVIAIIGALLMIIGVFLSWADVNIFGYTEGASGLDVFTDDDFIGVSYTFAPIVSLVCGIICLIGMIIPMVLPAKNIGKGLSILGLILAIVTIIVTALYYSSLGGEDYVLISYGAGVGVWVVIVGAVLVIIGGLIDFFVKPKQSEPEQQKPEEPQEPSEPA